MPSRAVLSKAARGKGGLSRLPRTPLSREGRAPLTLAVSDKPLPELRVFLQGLVCAGTTFHCPAAGRSVSTPGRPVRCLQVRRKEPPRRPPSFAGATAPPAVSDLRPRPELPYRLPASRALAVPRAEQPSPTPQPAPRAASAPYARSRARCSTANSQKQGLVPGTDWEATLATPYPSPRAALGLLEDCSWCSAVGGARPRRRVRGKLCGFRGQL